MPPRTNLSFTVGSIPPVLLSSIQDKDIIYTNNTVINLTFSNLMNPSATGNGSLNTLVDNNRNSEEIKSAEFVGTDNKVVKTVANLVTPPIDGPLPDATTPDLKDDKLIIFVLFTSMTTNYSFLK
ncbi:hypothetical protein UT300005_34660 [Clostridium sp. CTA-5]